jgi:Mn-dependent DtxR family transcriptional regulator
MVNLSDDEELYLKRLCDGSKHAAEVASQIMSDDSISKHHHSDSVADRLDALADDSKIPDAGHLVVYDPQKGYELTSQGRKQLCGN